jgi:hypothetical protein
LILASASRQPCDGLDFAALFYISIPLFIFFASFTKLWIAAPAVAVIVIELYRLRPKSELTVAAQPLDRRDLLTCAVVAALFLWVCGYARPFGHTFDWLKHFAIINELGQYSWPPINQERGTFLRYSLGYYLLPGLFTALLGNRWIEPLVFLQTWTGLLLVLALLLKKGPSGSADSVPRPVSVVQRIGPRRLAHASEDLAHFGPQGMVGRLKLCLCV